MTFADNIITARQLIVHCEADLHRELSLGECRDLLLDNTTWTIGKVEIVLFHLDDNDSDDSICHDGQCEQPRGTCRSCQAQSAVDQRGDD